MQIAPRLAVTHGDDAIAFYKSAFDAKLLWRLGHGAEIVARLATGGAKFFLAHEAREYGTRGPSSVGVTIARVELFVDDPVSVHRRAMNAGASAASLVSEDRYDEGY